MFSRSTLLTAFCPLVESRLRLVMAWMEGGVGEGSGKRSRGERGLGKKTDNHL